ncbi:MAG: hypothetical protein ABJP02_14215 [Parasphingorhabdus sp.]|uniref:hypothetical protein n=1 Tax=Parasphingorhabdus sp. TaxID=2709688 RepID=UPI003298F96D
MPRYAQRPLSRFSGNTLGGGFGFKSRRNFQKPSAPVIPLANGEAAMIALA